MWVLFYYLGVILTFMVEVHSVNKVGLDVNGALLVVFAVFFPVFWILVAVDYITRFFD